MTSDLLSRPRALLIIGGTTAFFTLSSLFIPSIGPARGLVSDVLLMTVAFVAGTVILLRAREPLSWEGLTPFGVAMLVLAVAKAISAIVDVASVGTRSATVTDLSLLIIGALFVLPARVQFHDHFRRVDRREIWADVALIAAAMISVVYLLIRPVEPSEALAAFLWSALFALTTAPAITSYIALTIWVPTPSHLGQLIPVGVFAVGTLVVGDHWVRGTAIWGAPALDLAFGLSTMGLAAVLVLRPEGAPHQVSGRGWGRPVLTTIAVASAAGSLGIVAALQSRGSASVFEGALLIGLLGGAIAVRILVNQLRSSQANDEVRQALVQRETALGQREAALAETARTLEQLRATMATLGKSEARLRLLFDAAVDGIVELDANDVVRQVNGAFCQMVSLERGFLEGKPWDRVAAAAPGGASIASLLVTGQATLEREGHEVFLEARSSEIPGNPPGTLLLVRDVTAGKVADQTIRSLFKFLQDRDEDRTRLTKRTNAAIEAERNRIARDLHDGPVQGVSAASLSLEAVVLMLRAGETEQAVDTLVKVRGHLSEEADNLRQLMGNLRPPLLEERGLIPALQETLARFGQDMDVGTRFRGRSLVDIPSDIETLAYRLVQEALTNAGKHARATEVELNVEAVAGQLQIEVIDNGVGFDPNQARDFLRAGKVGLASMRERIELASGSFLVRSTSGGGTTIVATLPLDSAPTSRELASN